MQQPAHVRGLKAVDWFNRLPSTSRLAELLELPNNPDLSLLLVRCTAFSATAELPQPSPLPWDLQQAWLTWLT